MEPEYEKLVRELLEAMAEFEKEANAGAGGRGSKASGGRARKLSNQITRDLKTFRKLSVEKGKE
ncbi:MAG: histone H1 [Candidatus Peribacteraceae bacterium]|nr:histone H1 [Candidatus Peribacteraceae bacterium]